MSVPASPTARAAPPGVRASARSDESQTGEPQTDEPAPATPDQNIARWRALHEGGYFATHRRYQDRLHDLGVAQIVRLATPGPSDTLLEVGCGYGRLLWHLLPLVGRVVGLDLHEGPLGEARALLAGRGEARLILGDGRTLAPIDSGSIDKVCAFTVLQHMTREGVARYLREFGRVLTPRGLGVVNFYDEAVRQDRMLDAAGEQSLSWSPAEICAAAEAARLTIHRLEREPLDHPDHGRGLVWWWLVFGRA